MMKSKVGPVPLIAIVAVVVVAAVALIGLGGMSSPSSGPIVTTVIQPSGSSVEARELNFIPEDITVTIGVDNIVSWVNEDNTFHTVVSDLFDSGPVDTGEEFSFTFEQSGKYEYFCSLHPWMSGSVTVG